MRLLFICAYERYLCTNSTYRDIVQHYVEHGKHQAKVIYTTEGKVKCKFTEKDFNVYNPDLVVFFDIDRPRYCPSFKFAFRRPVYICALDYFNCLIIGEPGGVLTDEQLIADVWALVEEKVSGFITFPRQPDVIKRYRDELPHKSFFSFDGRFVNTSIYKNHNEPKKYDILLYGHRSLRTRVQNLTAEQSYKTRWEKHHGSKLPHIHDFYPLRKRLERLLRRNGDRYNLKILVEGGSLGPDGEGERAQIR